MFLLKYHYNKLYLVICLAVKCSISTNTFHTKVTLNFPWCAIGPLHDPVTWYKIIYTGEQIAQWDFQNNAPAFVPLRNLLTSIYNFVPCDRVVQRAY